MSNSDFLFQWLLKIIPENLSKTYFYLLISSIIFALIIFFLFVLFKKKYISFGHFALMIPFIFLDRLFIDIAASSFRSSFSIIFFMLAIISKKKYFKLLLLLLSSSIHLRAFLFCMFINLVKNKLKNFKNHLFFIGLGILCLRFFGQLKIFNLNPEIANFAKNSLALNDSFYRGLTGSHLLSKNFFLIILFSIVIPYLCTIFVKDLKSASIKISNINLRQKVSLFDFSSLSTSFSLILFPDFSLALRFFLASLLVTPIYMKKNYLFNFVVLKLLIFAFVIKKYF